MAEILQGGVRDTVNTDSGGAIAKFVVTNITERRTFDANTVTLAETNDCLATVIRELIRYGILNGTVA
jgi:hypothetical protein